MRSPVLPACLLLCACATLSFAGVIQGVVVEHSTGRALSRTPVFLTPVPQTAADGQTPAKPLSARSGPSGQFYFSAVPPGMYILAATREGFFSGAYGQRLPTGRGAPITVTADSQFFAEIRLRHKGAVTGRVLDENGVGMPHVSVVAYRARSPLRSAGQGTSDDRGVYRIPGLEPGKYWVRSTARRLDDGSMWLPSFAPQGHEVRDARVFPVAVDADTAYADVTPIGGFLYPVSGKVTCDHAGDVVVTLSSDTGQQFAHTRCTPSEPGGYSFPANPVGLYEVFGTFQDNSGAAFIEVNVGGRTSVDLPLVAPSELTVETRMNGSLAVADVPVRVIARRQNLSETGPVFEITRKTAALPPGYWEFRAFAPPGYYVHSVAPTRMVMPGRRRPGEGTTASDWYELYIPPRLAGNVRVLLGSDGGRIDGKVLQSDRKSVPGAPVFLWPLSDAARKSLGGAPQTLSATDGSFAFESLPPGEYRLLATFDASELDSDDLIEASQAMTVKAGPGQTSTVDVRLWTAPW